MANPDDGADRGGLRPIEIRERTSAPPEAVYGLLEDLRSHAVWGGVRQAPGFRLLTLDAPVGPATVGTEFRSTGADGRHRINHDRSVVTEASPPEVFEFVTESRSLRDDGEVALSSTVVHRFEIERAAGGGSEVVYTFHSVRVDPVWAIFRIPVVSHVVLRILRSMLRRGIRNLLAMAAERAGASTRA